jgi:hypothetical protein
MIVTMIVSVWVSISGLALYLVVWGIGQRQHRAMKRLGEVKRATGTLNVVYGTAEPISSFVAASDKEFRGDLEATSKRRITNISDNELGSRLVLVERIVGTLHGRSGGFLLKYGDVTDNGAAFVVVPRSGTEGLRGITGTMTIRIENGKHLYDFEYTLNPQQSRQTSVQPSTKVARAEPEGETGHIMRGSCVSS